MGPSDAPSFVECPLAKAGRELPDQPAIVQGDRCVSFRELSMAADRFAQILESRGFIEGDRVLMRSENGWELIALIWACFRCRAIACPISYRIPSASVEIIAKSIDARCRFDAPSIHESTTLCANIDQRDTIDLDPSRAATIFFSSGTTGIPKAVVHSLTSHLFSALGSNKNIVLEPGDRWLLSLPLFHVGGLGVMFRCIVAGATIVIDNETRDIRQTITDKGITHLSLVATQLKRLLEQDNGANLSNVNAVLLGGSSLPEQLVLGGIDRGIPIRSTYGLTEMASQVTTTPNNVPPAKRLTCGRVLDHREIKIGAEDEILVRGETLFRGYYRNHSIEPNVDDHGWYHTNDLGRIDDDGFLSVLGRRDNMFISGGENIHPEAIENCLLDVTGIRQVVVVPKSDATYGFRPVAFVDAESFQVKRWIQTIREELPKFMVPDRFLAWPDDLGPSSIKPNRRQFILLAEEPS